MCGHISCQIDKITGMQTIMNNRPKTILNFLTISIVVMDQIIYIYRLYMKRYWVVGYVPKPAITFIGFTNPMILQASCLNYYSIYLFSCIALYAIEHSLLRISTYIVPNCNISSFRLNWSNACISIYAWKPRNEISINNTLYINNSLICVPKCNLKFYCDISRFLTLIPFNILLGCSFAYLA